MIKIQLHNWWSTKKPRFTYMNRFKLEMRSTNNKEFSDPKCRINIVIKAHILDVDLNKQKILSSNEVITYFPNTRTLSRRHDIDNYEEVINAIDEALAKQK